MNAKVPVYENIHFSDFLVPNDDNSTLESFAGESSEKIKTYITSLSSDKALTKKLPLRIIKSILQIIISSITYRGGCPELKKNKNGHGQNGQKIGQNGQNGQNGQK